MRSQSSPRACCAHLILASLALIGLALASGCHSGADTFATALPETARTSNSLPSQVDQQRFRYRLTSVPLQERTAQNREPAPFTLLAGGSERARIVDRDRNVVRSAPPGGTIFRFQLSPDRERVLLYFGDAKYTIASVDTLSDQLNLPTSPPMDDDVTGFRWFFLDDFHLFGLSQLRSTDTEDRMASEIDSLPPRATLIYVYALESQELLPVEIDDKLPSIFSIDGVSNGQITLLTFDDELLGAKIARAPQR